jgi:polyphosphate glucokinase
LGRKRWSRHVFDVAERLKAGLGADYVVLGGGNAKLLRKLPDGVRLGNNALAFAGGFRLWKPVKRAGKMLVEATRDQAG